MNQQATFKEFLSESSLTRVYQQSKKHDIGTITAFRNGYEDENGETIEYTKQENKQRNKSLIAKLLRYGYGITSVKGTYIENYNTDDAIEVSEDVFLVVDLGNRNDLRKNLKKLGAEFDQDSILFIPKGSQTGELIGTNDSKFPGFDKTIHLKNPIFGKTGEFYTRVNGRPFILKESTSFVEKPVKGWGRNYAIKLLAETPWREIQV